MSRMLALCLPYQHCVSHTGGLTPCGGAEVWWRGEACETGTELQSVRGTDGEGQRRWGVDTARGSDDDQYRQRVVETVRSDER